MMVKELKIIYFPILPKIYFLCYLTCEERRKEVTCYERDDIRIKLEN